MPEIVQQARLNDDEITILKDAIGGGATENLLKRLRTHLKAVDTLKRVVDERAITLDTDTTTQLRHELVERITAVDALPHDVGDDFVRAHRKALAILDALDQQH